MSTYLRWTLVGCVAAGALVVARPRAASAWGIGSQLYLPGCHERITAEALRNARMAWPTAPVIPPTRDEAALIDEVQFEPPSDLKGDLAGMSLLLGVRDNDLKGNNPLDSLRLTEVHGNPDTQDEHCIRGAHDDGPEGNASALAACGAFILGRATEALDGLGADGVVDPSQRMELRVYVSFAGKVHPKLPLFYVKMGQALHALEDGFTHTYRTPDGMRVTYVLNWIDYANNTGSNEDRDGPPHLSGMDRCQSNHPIVTRNFDLATTAATEMMETALNPMLTREQKIAAFDATIAKYLTFQPGCTIDNDYCNALEPDTGNTVGCSAGGATTPAIALVVLALALALRRRATAGFASLVLLLGVPRTARADDPPPDAGVPAPAPAPAPVVPPTVTPEEAPAVPVEPKKPDDIDDAMKGKEPGRDVRTPTVEELENVREDKRLGSEWGFAGSIGGSVVHGAANVTIGGRYRLNERWVVGLDVEWNPWITSVPLALKAGSFNAYATAIRRFPMKFDRVNLRTSLHVGVSTLLFDVTGAPKYDWGPYVGFAPLGIDYDLGHSVRFVLDPVEIAVPVPHIGLIPLYYEQFRVMVGLQIGA